MQRSGKNPAHFHLADSIRLPTDEGTGLIPTVMETLKKTDFDCYLTMEIGFNRRDVDPEVFAKPAYDHMRWLTAT